MSSGTGLQQKRLLGSRGENVGQHDFTLSCTTHKMWTVFDEMPKAVLSQSKAGLVVAAWSDLLLLP